MIDPPIAVRAQQTSGPVSAMSAVPASGDRKLLAGLVGAGIGASLTPALQEEEARQHGLRLHYQLIDLDAIERGPAVLPELIAAARMIGFAGLNITYPVKQTVLALLDDLSADARAIGAVNTIILRDGRMVGYNTDASGWRWGFERALPAADLSAVALIGAGGAGSAIAHAVLTMGAERLLVHDLSPAKARDLVQRVAGCFPGRTVAVLDDPASAIGRVSGLVNATPTGMTRFPGLPVPRRLLRAGLWVADAVYFPLETELLATAREAGCLVVDGGTMAVGQAAGAFELFTGLKPDAERMGRHFSRLVSAPPSGLLSP